MQESHNETRSQMLMQIIRERRSIRAYRDDSISSEEIEALVEAAIWAPSSCNRQSLFIVAVDDNEKKQKLYAWIYHTQKHVKEAPLVLVIFADQKKYPRRVKEIGPLLDGAVAAQNILLLGHTLGLGCCLVAGILKEKQIRRLLDMPGHFKVVGMITVGRPKSIPLPPPRRPINEHFGLNKFKE